MMKITKSDKKCDDKFDPKTARTGTIMASGDGTVCVRLDEAWGYLGCVLYFEDMPKVGSGGLGPYTKYEGSVCLENE